MTANSDMNHDESPVSPDVFDSGKKPVMVKSIYRAANILNCISNGINSVTDVATHCNLSKSTVHRLLHALVESGLVMRDPINREYLFGHLISRLVSNPRMTHEYLIRSAVREMQFLGDHTREAIALGIKVGMNCVGLHVIPSTHALRVVDDKNLFGDLHIGSSGRVLLSQISNAELQRAIPYIRSGLPEGQARSDEKRMIEDIEVIREQGYAVSNGERVPGGICIAVPVKYYHLPVVLSLFGPEGRISPHTREYLDVLLGAASRIGRRIRETLVII